MRQAVIQKAEEKQRRQQPNLTGIPTQMKMDFEQRSGLSFDDVRVHYNSDKPRKIGALAYTQGTQVHIGPGQERHLRHELGHVVQQKQGIVRPDTQHFSGLDMNTDAKLEYEADLIGHSDMHFAKEQNSKQFQMLIVGEIDCGRLLLPAAHQQKQEQGYEDQRNAFHSGYHPPRLITCIRPLFWRFRAASRTSRDPLDGRLT